MIRSKRYIGFVFIVITVLFLSNTGLRGADRILPLPGGEYKIGTYSFTLENNRIYKKNKKQRICIKVWYPSDSLVCYNQLNKYLEDYDLNEIVDVFKNMSITKKQLLSIASSKTHSAKDIPVAKGQLFPVVLFTPGYYFGFNDIYSSYIENLASNGYIVFAVSHVKDQVCPKGLNGEDNSLPKARAALPFFQMWWKNRLVFKDINKEKNHEYMTDYYLKNLKRFNKILEQWESNTNFVIDYIFDKNNSLPNDLNSSMDLTKVGIMGQSFGGALSNHVCLKNDKILASINMDCFQFGDVKNNPSKKPLMLIEGDEHPRWMVGNKSIYHDYPNLRYGHIDGGKHFLFSDLPYYESILDSSTMDKLVGHIDNLSATKWTNSIVVSFFNQHLKGIDSTCSFEEISEDNFSYQISNKCIYLK